MQMIHIGLHNVITSYLMSYLTNKYCFEHGQKKYESSKFKSFEHFKEIFIIFEKGPGCIFTTGDKPG